MRKVLGDVRLPATLLATAMLAGCANQPWLFGGHEAPAPARAATQQAVTETAGSELYEVHKDGRIYLFDDFRTYNDFLQHGETPYRYMRIGEGPQGETLVFGLSTERKNAGAETPAAQLYDGRITGRDQGFYGEVLHDGRFHVFDRWHDLAAFRETYEAPYRYTQIGEGPGGRTVVYVLNADNKTEKPVDLVAEFKRRHRQPEP